MYDAGEWLRMPCPLAPYTHASGKDEHPSFNVRVNPDGSSFYYCFGCSPKANRMSVLIHLFFVYTGKYPFSAARVYVDREIFDEEGKPPPVIDVWEQQRPAVQALARNIIDRFPLIAADMEHSVAKKCIRYLEQRGISLQAAISAGVRFSPENGTILYSLTDIRGAVYGLRERKPSMTRKEMWTVNAKSIGDESAIFPSVRHVGAWFNLHSIDWTKPVMLVEGPEDALRLVTLRFGNAISACTTKVTDRQVEALCGDVYYLGYDNDKAGRKAVRRIWKQMDDRASLWFADWSKARSDCKDAGDLKKRGELEAVLLSLKKLKPVTVQGWRK
jgi:DNA primase